MCEACAKGVSPIAEPTPPKKREVAFEALRNGDYRAFLTTNVMWMIGDQTEHAISYWALFQLFHSPFLAGFAVLSHWIPFLVLSVPVGALADRFDCRKIIQTSNLLFMAVSIIWGVLLATNQLQIWHSVVLLTIHGLAGAISGPASQLIIHDIVGPRQLQSGVRLNSTGLQLGYLLGPAVGGLLLIALGPTVGLFVNAAIYLPRTIWLLRTPFTGHVRESQTTHGRRGIGLGDAVDIFRSVSSNRTIVAMIALSGSSALLIGTAFLVLMPQFASRFQTQNSGLTYTLLLSAHALGGVLGGVVLDALGLLRARSRTAVICMGFWAVSMIGFAFAPSYPIALAFLFLAGGFSLTFGSMAQTLVQLLAPAELRGRVVGLYTMSSAGMRAWSGITVGVLGGFIGINWSLGISGAVLLAVALGMFVFTQRDAERLNLAEKGIA